MRSRHLPPLFTAVAFTLSMSTPVPSAAQTTPNPDPILQRLWTLGMESPHTYLLAQALLDSIGPRLTGTLQNTAAVNWLLARYTAWGIPTRKESYDKFRGWRRGITHIDLVAPRTRTLEGALVPWSPGTDGKDIEGDIVLPPTSADDRQVWLSKAKGKFVLIGSAEPTCRPVEDWQKWAAPNSEPGRPRSLPALPQTIWISLAQLEKAGVAGVLTPKWAEGWGVDLLHWDGSDSLPSQQLPTLQLSCEDFGLVSRLATHGQRPRLRLNAQAERHEAAPVHNVLAELTGTEKPKEYVILSAHLDSWDGASGATDNGTGTIMMMEAMRLLKEVYPRPKRTILVGHWNGEEQGMRGSRDFVQQHPEIVQNVHVLFNQDNGTGRITKVSGQGIVAAGAYFSRWLAQVPDDLTREIQTDFPGIRSSGFTDHGVFLSAGAPAFSLSGLSWNYGYTWHTTRDTFDKINFDDLRANAILVAMLAYLASEDTVMLPREARTKATP